MTETPDFLHDEALYRRIVEESPAAVVLLTNEPAARVLFASPRIEEISGFTPDDLLTQPGLWVERLHPEEAHGLGARWASAVASGERFSEEYRFLHRTGEWRWIREISSPVRAPDGTVRYRQSFTEDITSERFAEAQAERSEARYRALVERLPVIVYVDSDEFEPMSLYISPNSEEVLGMRPDALIADRNLWMASTHPDDRERIRAAWAESVRTRRPFREEYRRLRPNGDVVWVRDESILVRDDDDLPMFWQGVLLDITAERSAETAFRRSEDRYRDLIEHLPFIVYIDAYGPAEASRYVSPNVLDVLGHPAEAFDRTFLWQQLLHPDDLDRALAAWGHGWSTGAGWSVEYRFVHPDGHDVPVRDEARMVVDPATGEPTWQGVIIDLTAEKQSEAELRRSEQLHRALVEQVPAVVYLDRYDEGRHTTFNSPRVTEMTGIPPQRWIDDPGLWQRVIHPDDLERVRTELERCVAETRTLDIEYRWRHLDGHEVWVHDTCAPVLGEDGAVEYWLGVMIDITEQRLAEQRLLASERRYRALVEQVPAIMYEMGPDDERRTLFVSPHVEAILGYKRQEWLDQPDIWVELLHPDDRERELAAHDRHNETGEPWQREYRLIASDGREVWVHDQAQLVHDAEGSRWLGVMLDITPQKDAEELLRLAKDELEMRVLTRTAELEDANEMMSLEIGERRRIEGRLREAETRYRLLLEDLPAAVYSWETNWEDDPEPADTALYTSPQLERILGFPREEWHRPGFWQERLHPHDRDRIIPLAEHSIETGEPFSAEYRYLAADGRIVWVLDRATLRTRDRHGRPRLFQGVMLDITELKEAEAKAREAEERFRRLAEEGPFVVYQFELEHGDPPVVHLRYLSPSAAELLNVPASLWVGGSLGEWFELMHPDDVERMRPLAQRAFATGGPWNYVFRMIGADGRIVWLLDRGRAIERDAEGRPTFFQGIMLDVTEEAELHAALETSEATLRSLVETMPATPWTEVMDPASGRGKYRFIGPQVQELFGYTPHELFTEPDHFFRLVHPDDRERLKAASDRCDRTGEPWDQFYRVEHRDGSVHWIFSYARRTFEDDRPVWHGVSIDVTRHVTSGSFPVAVGDATEVDRGLI
ncbi:MAG TPA: PAS domain-containing protein [Actinomycetota bacterium]|nr:PAS domain-containing protein [Actinomycetota bacterium]